MKKNWKKICLYGVCILICAFYLLVLWWGKNPQVGTEYRMYYITHELSDWPGYGNLKYEPGTLEYTVSLKDKNGSNRDIKVCQTKGQGWEKEQYEGSVNKGTDSYVYFEPTETGKSAVLKFNISQFSGQGTVSVYVNDKKTGTFDKAGDYALSFEGYEKGQLIMVKFAAADCTFTLMTIEMD